MITLSGKDLIELLDYISPDRESEPEQLATEVSVIKMDEPFSSSSGVRPSGVYAYLTEYPEEGLYGPLGAADEEHNNG